MSSKRFNNLSNNTKAIPAEVIEKLIPTVKKNCTTKFEESIDLNLQINNKQKKNEINLRAIVNLPEGTGKKIKVGVVCEENKVQESKDAGADIVGGDDFIHSEMIVDVTKGLAASWTRILFVVINGTFGTGGKD